MTKLVFSKIFTPLFSAKRSIKHQVIAFLIVGTSLMTLLISLATNIGVTQHYRTFMLENAMHMTESLAKRAVFPLLSASEQNAQEALEQVTSFQQVLSARLLFEDHRLLFSSGNFPQPNQHGQRINHTSVIEETANYWLLKAPVMISNELAPTDANQFELDAQSTTNIPVGYVELIYSKKLLSQAQFQIAFLIACIGIASVFLLVLVLNTGLQKLFLPLDVLASTMKKAKDTGEHIQTQIKGAQEIADMAQVYNSMMQALDQQEEALKRHRDSLEQEVNIRTQELIYARDSAVDASKHKSEFIANMSHELRTPIQSIIGYGELVVEELELEGHFDLIEDMDKIAKNAQRLLLMINSLLDLAKIESGRIELNETELSLTELQNNIIDTITPLAHKNDNSFSLIDHCTVKRLTTDKDKLEQVLLNLLSNACKFSKNDGIKLIITNTSDTIIFEVKDNGIGLTEEQQKYIFDEFRQVDASQSRQFSGTGLGLAISKRFVNLMGGEIRVNSKLGQGAEFTISLPIK